MQFIDLSIINGGGASDVIAFEVSDLHHKLSQIRFLVPKLTLFGDNAYINTEFIATPFPNCPGEPKEA